MWSLSPIGLGSLLGLVAVLYWPVRGFEFVNWDDPWYVLNNPLITSWRPSNLWRILTELSVRNYAPLTTLSLLVDHTLYGLDASGYHVTNVLLHATNAVLVWILVSRLTDSRGIGLATAVLFAVHPVQVESVAWVSSRKTLMCSTFMLASGICWFRTDRTAKHELWGTAWLALALLSKAAAIVVPPIVLTYDLLVRRVRFAEALPRQFVPGLLCLLLLNVTISAQATEMGGVRGHLELGKAHILAVDAVILWKYVGMLVWPSQLCVLYDPPTHNIALPVICSIAGWCLIAVMSWRLRNRRPLVTWTVLTWLLLLLPVLNLLPITTLMNDRYLYLPSVCLFALAAGALAETGRLARRQRLAVACGAGTLTVVAVAFASVTMQHLPVWKNDLALWEHAVRRTPGLPVVQIQWADALRAAGERERAIAVLQRTLAEGRVDDADRERINRRLREWESEPRGS